MLDALTQEIIACERCPRLREHCNNVAAVKRRAYLSWDYWGRPVPGFGDPQASVLLLGLAPGAHGSNRTGRMFTGDKSGEFLYTALHKTGFANQAHATSREDGLELRGVYITAAARCAPPGNKPTPEEIRNCRPFLERELALLTGVRVVVALGKIAFDTYLDILKSRGSISTRTPFVFGHGCRYATAPGEPWLLTCYHPSQQNTSTGKLTLPMLVSVLRRARRLAEGPPAT